MIDSQVKDLQEGLGLAHSRVLEAISGISEVEAHQVPAEREWTVAQLLAHIAEILDFWTGKSLLIIREDDPNITRSDVENDIRLAAVTDRSSDSLANLTESLDSAYRQAVDQVGTIQREHLALLGHRGENNPITVKGVIEFLTGHVEEHARQIVESRRLIAESREGRV